MRARVVFLVGIEIAMTESMALCDVVLPAATHFECDDLYGAYGHHWLQRAEAVISPVGEALPNTEIFRRLAARFGFGETAFRASDLELMDEAVDPAHPALHGRRPSTISTSTALRMKAVDGRSLALFDTHRPATPSGKVELVSEVLSQRWARDTAAVVPPARYSLSPDDADLTRFRQGRFLDTPGDGRRPTDVPPLMMNPKDAVARKLEAGSHVRGLNNLGEVVLPLEITDAVPPGVVASEKGAWIATSPTGQTISALVSTADRADLGEGACCNDTGVEVAMA